MSLLLFVALSIGSFAHEAPPPQGPVVHVDLVRGSLMDGAGGYRACYYCHSLKPGVHLTGPSLANLLGKKAGRVEGFELYSDALKKSGLIWNEVTLKAWLANPSAKVPGTSMTFQGVKNAESLNGLVSFLKIAMGPNGFEEVQKQKLVSLETAQGQLPKDVSRPSKSDQITEIEHCKNVFVVKTADGKTARHWDVNLDFKVNAGLGGPLPGQPVVLPVGSMGDRFAIIFRSSTEIPKFLKECAAR